VTELFWQIVHGFVSSTSPGPAPKEKWQQVYVEVTEAVSASVEENGLLAPSATVDHNGSLLFQLIPNR
jgi:hypothetical protein